MNDLLPNTLYNHYRHTIPFAGGIKANIFIIEVDGIVHTIQIFIGKAGSDVNGWAYSFADLLSYMIQNLSLDEVIGRLSDISLNIANYKANTFNDEARSAVEAVAIALRNYRSFKEQ